MYEEETLPPAIYIVHVQRLVSHSEFGNMSSLWKLTFLTDSPQVTQAKLLASPFFKKLEDPKLVELNGDQVVMKFIDQLKKSGGKHTKESLQKDDKQTFYKYGSKGVDVQLVVGSVNPEAASSGIWGCKSKNGLLDFSENLEF